MLTLYNSLTRTLEPFKPLKADNVCVYACGPTVYNYAHIGNARMAVVFDTLVRVLRSLYPKVTYASNITDVDDKIMIAARESGREISEITSLYTDIYNRDMGALGCVRPDIQPKATEHIGEMIAMISDLIERGHAYHILGAEVLFHVPSYPMYGKLSGRSRDEQIAGARVEISLSKKDPADFVLWKPSKPDEVGWDSPWGRGRPGWHIECSAMSAKHLGLPFDIHGGGADLKFPHHENEIAQSCCAMGVTDDPSAFAKVWVHNGFVTANGEKMSKSIGNIVLPHDLLEQGVSGETMRAALLSAHYRQPLDWSDDSLHQATKFLERIKRANEELIEVASAQVDVRQNPVLEALCDDLNTPKAYAALNLLIKEALATRSPEVVAHFRTAQEILNLGLEVLDEEELDPALIAEVEALIQQRIDARAAKDFAKSDEIRDLLKEKGIAVIDSKEGMSWKKL